MMKGKKLGGVERRVGLSLGFGLAVRRRLASLCDGRDLFELHQRSGSKFRRDLRPKCKQAFHIGIVWECSGSNSLSQAVSLGHLLALWQLSL